jgi:hypothetical protein
VAVLILLGNQTMNKTRLMTVLTTLAVIAVINRIQPAKDALNGDEKFLGLF